jgi:NAD(P)-dependent dehydrogenase (short-subunit alcohol dehydrogenase family)
MSAPEPSRFSLDGKVAVVTGGSGVLGRAMAMGLASAGARVAVLGRRSGATAEVVEAIEEAGGEALAIRADVTDREALSAGRDQLVGAFGGVDVLVNAAGGNTPEALVAGDRTFFAMGRAAYESVLETNLTGTLLPSQVFGELMAGSHGASIINISSMAATLAISRVLGYSVAKAGVDSLTRWLAVEMAQRYGDRIRVNAIAPGFFVGEQNRDLLLDASGELTERGRLIIQNTPVGRFGEPDELVGAVIWLASDAARFVTGTVIPVDGGFSIYSGV